jgi:hypothetical protein
MVRIRKYARGGAVPLDVEIDTPRSHIETEAITDQMMHAHEDHDFEPKVEHGDASVAFQGQIDALRRSEQMQRGHAGMSREEKSQHWRDNGIGGDDLQYLHELEDHPQITVAAVADARKQGHAEDTQQFHQAVKTNFRKLLPQLKQSDHVAELEDAYAAGDVGRQAEITTRISKAETARARLEDEDESDRRRGRIVSAPVSRDTMGTGGGSYGADRPGKVTMTPEMKMAAKISGISETEYAQQVLRLREEKLNGNYTGRP